MEKLKYQDKVKFVDTALEMIKQEKSRAEIESYLAGAGLKKWDIDKVNQSIDNYLKNAYKEKIKSYMLDNSLESKLSEFDDMDAGLFEKIQYELIAEIKLESSAKVKSMIMDGKSEEEVLKRLSSPYPSEEEVYDLIDKEAGKIKKKKSQLNQGIGAILVGVILTIGSIGWFDQDFVLFYGLIFYGIYLIYQAKFKD